MAWPYAESDDIENVYRTLTDSERTVADALIEQAANRLRVRIPTIDTVIQESYFKETLARDAVVNAVERVLRNPDRLRQYSTAQGPFSDSRTFDSGAVGLYIDPADINGLLPARRPIARSFHVRSGLQ